LLIEETSLNPSEFDLSGLQFMQAVVAGRIAMPPMADTVPMRCTHAAAGTVVFAAQADARHLNRAAHVHGGFTATVMDSVASCALRTVLPAGVSFVTIELNVKYLKPVPPNVELRATGQSINASKRLGVAQAQLFDNSGTLCAHATATFMLLPPRIGQRGDGDS
jgi:uncharacterized protein (TIGR00369 family)